MKSAKIGAVFLVAVMALTAVGAAYAHWEETLTITGYMETDDIDPGFYCADSNDDPDDSIEYQWDPTDCGDWTNKEWVGTRRAKNVGWMTANEAPDKKSIAIEIGDAYPCYYSHAFWCVENYGSCPVLIHSVQLTKISEAGHEITLDSPIDLVADGTVWYIKIDRPEGMHPAGVPWNYDITTTPNDPADYDFSIMPTGDMAINTQLDPHCWQSGDGRIDPNSGEVYDNQLEQDLCIHFENGCEQDTSYDFTIELCFYNWPEAVVG